MSRAPIIGSVQQGGNVGQMLQSAGQGSLNRLTQAFQQQQALDNAQVQAEANRQQQRDMQASAIGAAHQQQMLNIDAQQENQRFLAEENMKRMVVGAGLQDEAAKTAFENSLEVERERARQQAATYDRKFTTEQRLADANLARAEQVVKQADWMNPQEKEQALGMLQLERSGVAEPTEMLGDPNARAPEPGKELGAVWPGENGGLFTTDSDGVAKLLIRPDQTIEYMQEKAKVAAEVAEQDRERVRFQAEQDRVRDEAREDSIRRQMFRAAQAAKPIEVGSGKESVKRLPFSSELDAMERAAGFNDPALQEGAASDLASLQAFVESGGRPPSAPEPQGPVDTAPPPQEVEWAYGQAQQLLSLYGSYEAMPSQALRQFNAYGEIVDKWENR